jgi:hypothetical protein
VPSVQVNQDPTLVIVIVALIGAAAVLSFVFAYVGGRMPAAPDDLLDASPPPTDSAQPELSRPVKPPPWSTNRPKAPPPD